MIHLCEAKLIQSPLEIGGLAVLIVGEGRVVGGVGGAGRGYAQGF